MGIDSRAYAWCNLGPLAEGSSVAESHVQGAGVVTVRGTINLAGVYRPAPGAVVELAYSDGQNWLARLPVRLRVLSSFANPLGGKTTSVSVGCDLAFYDNRKQPPSSLTTREANPSTPEAVWRAAAPAIPASWLVEQILSALGLTAAGSIPLTNFYTRQEFDMTAGYVEELGKLCQSEGYVARMTPAGLVEFISKDPALGTSILLTEEDLIDLNPINTGELPGDSVYAKFTTLKLRPPDDPTDEDAVKKRNWEKEVVISGAQQYIHNWTSYTITPKLDSNGQPIKKQRRNSRGFPVVWSDTLEPVMDTVYETKASQEKEYISYITRTITATTYDSKDRAIKRTVETLGLWGYEFSETSFTYRNGAAADGSDDELLQERTIEFSSLAPMKMSVGYQLRYSSLYGPQYQSSIRQVDYEKNKTSGITRTRTLSFVPRINTPWGAESIARMRDNEDERTLPGLDPLAQILANAKQLVSYGSETRIRTEREFGVQRRPSEAERTAEANQKAPAVEQTAQSVWAVGSAASQTQVELSPPYAPDDRIVEAGGVYTVIKGDAEQKALAYARIENRLLLGHRNGVGIQLLPELLPPAPLGLVFIRLNNATAAFRCNGTTWNIDPQGVTATTDALFWGAIDGAVADAWFPLPPGIASLPAPVAITTNANPRPANAISIPNGFSFTAPNLSTLFASLPTGTAPTFPRTVTPGVLRKPWTETTSWSAGAGAGVIVTTQPWIPQTRSLTVGAGSGVIAELRRTLAGAGGGAIATYYPIGRPAAWSSGASTFAPGAAAIATPAFTGVQWTSGASTFTPGLRNGLTASNTAAITIPESGSATPYPSTITVADGLGLLVDKLTVTISGFSHTYPQDIALLLVGPGGARSQLLGSNGGSAPVSDLTITFDSAAASNLPATLISGTFKPGGGGTSFPAPAPSGSTTASLTNFANTPIFGTWSLYAIDTASPDSGSISGGWSMQISYKPDTTAVTNPGVAWISAASTFAPGAASVVTPSQVGIQWSSDTSTFTPGARSVADPTFSQTSLLLLMDGSDNSTTFIDSGPGAYAVTRYGNTIISTVQSRFGGASAYFDGNADYLTVIPATAHYYTGDFTIELWFYMTTYKDCVLMSSANSNQNNVQLFRVNSAGDGSMAVYLDNNEAALGFAIGPVSSVFTTNTWVHVALARSGSTGRLFVNGTLVGTKTNWTTGFRADVIGCLFNSGTRNTTLDFAGYIDATRNKKGTALYTSDFAVPTAPFPTS